MRLLAPHHPTPEWAVACLDRILKTDDPDALDALLVLLVGLAPTEEEERFKHDAAWAAIEYGYRKTGDCDESCRKYVGLAG